MVSSYFSSSLRMSAAESWFMCGWVEEWLPTSLPRAAIAFTFSGYLSAQKPQRKNVA